MREVKLEFSKHAIERMLHRGVSDQDVKKTLEKPTSTSQISSQNTQEYRRKEGDRVNFVVVEHRKNSVLVITTGWGE